MLKEVYHGSNISGLKTIEPKESTQKGAYIYSTVSPLVTLYFTQKSSSLLMNISFKYINVKKIYRVIERVENILVNSFSKPVSIYVLNGEDFDYFSEHNWEKEEVRSSLKQNVVKEIRIENPLEELQKYVTSGDLIINKYGDRPKRIPQDDTDLLKGAFIIYLWG